ncbi:transporter [Granulicella cerasi]|uniref:Transporter n=1 Tax=Granulicella cerasi TaxID=741063 RepID=A0ABW1Z7J7_9BACT|nr:transporter [Granulicella cerasi]
MPTVNLGLTSFLDGIAQPGWLVEQYGQAVHDDRTIAADGSKIANAPGTNSGSGLSHVVYLAPRKVLGAWYGAEYLIPEAYVNAGAAGTRGGVGDMTVGPMLQWPEKHLFGMPLHQRVLADFEVPTGTYTAQNSAINIGANTWTVHPYYAFTLLPTKRLETSWRISYLWNSTNQDPAAPSNVQSTQAGQALHFNATVGWKLFEHVYVGANGYMFHQLTNSQVNHIAQPGTEVLAAIGPGFTVQHGSWFYYVNAYREFGAVDTSEGNKIAVRIAKAF